MSVVYRDAKGVEYEAVPLPTHEVTHAIRLDARIVSKRSVRKNVPLYDGADGEVLATQPRSHRRHWTDTQWGAFEEYRRVVADYSQHESPVATAVVLKTTR